jgi:TPR repeat protein
MKRLAAILALALGLVFNASAGMDEGVQYYISGEYDKALAEFKPLAEKGDAKAQYYVGFMYHHGYGMKRDEAEAAKWFLMGANQGEWQSQYYLGVIYEKGVGMKQDLPAAHMWLSLAATNPGTTFRDSLHTKEAVNKLEHKMNPEQIAQAKDMAKGWKPQN